MTHHSSVSGSHALGQWRAAPQPQRVDQAALWAEIRRVETNLLKQIDQLKFDRRSDRLAAQNRILVFTIFFSHAAVAAVAYWAVRLG